MYRRAARPVTPSESAISSAVAAATGLQDLKGAQRSSRWADVDRHTLRLRQRFAKKGSRTSA